MKTWRERIVEARERGHFSEEDRMTWRECATCFVGEVTVRLVGGVHHFAYDVLFYQEIQDSIEAETGGSLQGDIWNALVGGNFDRAESLLDAIEDRALQLKRERSEPEPAEQATPTR